MIYSSFTEAQQREQQAVTTRFVDLRNNFRTKLKEFEKLADELHSALVGECDNKNLPGVGNAASSASSGIRLPRAQITASVGAIVKELDVLIDEVRASNYKDTRAGAGHVR